MSGPLFDPPAYVREVEEAAARAGGWTLRHLTPCAASARPWFQRPGPAPDAPALYLSAGIHGDEIAGPAAALEMIRRPGFFDGFAVTLFPILNPDGLAKNLRGNADGLDLNRDYREPKSAEIAGHIAALQTLGRFDGAIFLHEDFEGIGAYLFELNETLPPDLGADMVQAMGRHVPVDLRSEIDEMPARGGVISRRDVALRHGRIEDRPDWPEAVYLLLHHTGVAYTTETPMPFPLDARVRAQVASVETLMAAIGKVR